MLLNYSNNPQDNLKIIHIAGTNGKGSITTTLSNVLVRAGYKVGKFISPYLESPYEMIQINNQFITETNLNKQLLKLVPCIEQMKDAPTAYEIMTALAFAFFYEQKCDVICLETGLGGINDATNVIKSNLISIISVIDYDHMEYLGSSIEAITKHKCGIIKPNKTTIVYSPQRKAVMRIIKKTCHQMNNKLIKVDLTKLNNLQQIGYHYRFCYKNKKYELGLKGNHQVYNSLVVIETIEELNRNGFKISYPTTKVALKETRLNGRLDIISKNPIIILDGTHNLSGIKSLKSFIKKQHQRAVFIVGMIDGKEHDKCFKELKSIASKIIVTEINNDLKKLKDINYLYSIAKKYQQNVFMEINQKQAYQKAMVIANPDDLIVITGSLYLVAEYYDLLKQMKVLI